MQKTIAIIGLLIISGNILAQVSVTNYGNGLPATDGLGRKLLMPAEAGGVRDKKLVGLFYWTWHTDDNASFSPVMNITEILKQYPEAATQAGHPAWKGITPGVFWWDEPLMGYYRTTDEWVLRKHAEMLADAGVDVVFFDCTNGRLTWKTSYSILLKVWNQARKDGIKTPQICFMLPFGASPDAMATIQELYSELYQPQLYKDLWFLWNGKPLIMAYPESLVAQQDAAALKFNAAAPFYGISAACPSWGNNIGNLKLSLYKWNTDYSHSVTGTPIVSKTFVDFADNAKLSISFEQQKPGDYIWVLDNSKEQVGVWRWTDSNDPVVNFFNGAQISGAFESEIAYNAALNYTPLTTGNNHDPIAITSTVSQADVDNMKHFFTFRPGQPDYVNGPTRNDQWGWLENYPQHGYVSKTGGGFEQATVGVGQNASDATGGHAGGFNTPLSYGRSYTKAKGQDPRANAYLYGLNFQEQWGAALTLDPDLIFVTGWNEWIAGRWFNWDIKPFAFVDEYSAEKSRDIEPVKSWGNKGDVYYMQFVNNIRKYKGMNPEQPASAAQSINLQNTTDWTDVKPAFLSPKGNTMHRNNAGQGSDLIYTNTTGRNDIVQAKVARDNEYIYFYVETNDTLTDKTEDKWMRLFLDIDRNKATGWEGYDFVINRNNATDSVSIEKSDTSWSWTKVGAASYVINGKTFIIKIKRSLIGIATDALLNFEFKWSDNMQEDGNIMDFYVNGDVAPAGRFNYHYFVTTIPSKSIIKSTGFRVYPNPVSDGVKIIFPVQPVVNSQLTIYNVSGKILWKKKYNAYPPTDYIKLDFIKNKGVYIFELKNRNVKETQKIVVN